MPVGFTLSYGNSVPNKVDCIIYNLIKVIVKLFNFLFKPFPLINIRICRYDGMNLITLYLALTNNRTTYALT